MKYKVNRKQNISAMCIVCGDKNGLGIQTRFYECTNESGEDVLLTVFTPRAEHQSYPGIMHGGMTAAILDEACGRAMSIHRPEKWGVTLELQVKYRKPVPLGAELYCETKMIKETSRGFEGEGKMFDRDGKILATAVGTFVYMDPLKINAEGVTPENWYYIEEELPEYIEIG
ncbi:MAG: PaaI family thioesterase [Firmicutes bacterium]|nr:PaaI family thioesterase [Bacillota bacterium]